MTITIDADRIRRERLRRAWSQDQLAQVAGLGLRTVHRIENSGQCSLDSLRAVASAFGLLPHELQVDSPGVSTEIVTREGSKQSLTYVFTQFLLSIRKYLTGGLVGGLLTLGGLVMTSSVSASQVFLGVQGSITSEASDSEHSLDTTMLIDEGSSAVIEIDRLLRIELSPAVGQRETILLNAKIYTWKNDRFILAATPAVLTEDRKQASIHMTLPGGQEIAFDLTPEMR